MTPRPNSSHKHKKSGKTYVPSEWEIRNYEIVGQACAIWLRKRGVGTVANRVQQHRKEGQ
jgi:hypothetical protein